MTVNADEQTSEDLHGGNGRADHGAQQAGPSLVPGEGAAPVHFSPGPNHASRLAAVELAVAEGRNPFLEAGKVLLRTLAELPELVAGAQTQGLNLLLVQELQTFTRLCEQANLRRDHMLASRFVLCTALDEAVNAKPGAGGGAQQTGAWSTMALLNRFHGESEGGEKVFLLIGRLSNAPDEHMPVLELIHHLLSLGFKGSYTRKTDGDRMLQTIRHRLYTLVAASREPVPRELSPHWQGVGQGKFKLLRSIPVWVSASVLGLLLFAQFSWFKYTLMAQTNDTTQRIEALAKLQPPPVAAKPVVLDLNLTQLLQPEIQQGRVQVEEDAQHARVTFKGDGMFAGGLTHLSPAAQALLVKVGGALAKVPGSVRVVGHTDNLPIATPQFPSNQALSEARAQAVAKVLVAQGVEGARIDAVGSGDTAPVAPNVTAAGRGLNRRVEIQVLPEGVVQGMVTEFASPKAPVRPAATPAAHNNTGLTQVPPVSPKGDTGALRKTYNN
ncbi:outer membrane protein A [Comamonadaceae bacterium OS-1]|nr:outer membrane protein A [Comamonadaceae bacterium OS-1]